LWFLMTEPKDLSCTITRALVKEQPSLGTRRP
jgi:hypothetical protein